MGKFRDIKKTLIKLNASEEIIDYVHQQIKNKDHIIEEKSRSLEIINRKCCDIEKRYIEIFIVDSSSSKITINPCDGRVTLKISDKSSGQVRNDYVELTNKILNDNTLEPIVLRGKIRYRDDKYTIAMYSNSKRFVKYYELKSLKEK